MRQLMFAFLMFFGLNACTETEEIICDEPLTCEDDQCLFTIDNTQGNMRFLLCYNSWGIYAPNGNSDGSSIWLIPDNLSASYQEEDLAVVFCGFVRPNTIPLAFADPAIGTVYQLRLDGLEGTNK